MPIYCRKMTSKIVSCAFFVALSLVPLSFAFSAATDEPIGEDVIMPLYEDDAIVPPPQPETRTADLSTPSAGEPSALPSEETILARPMGRKVEAMDPMRSYFVQTGAALPIYDEDFREFVDYGGSVTLGLKKKVMDHLYLMPALGLGILNGDWDWTGQRGSIKIEEQIYNTTYGDYTDDLTPGDVNPVNTGDGYMSGGEAVVLNAEFLRSIDLQTSMYLIPLTLNLRYQLHDDGVEKINPYLGGGIGVCWAKRDVESRTLKEKQYGGPDYYLDFNDSQTVYGGVLQLFAGIEIPFRNNIKLVAESTTALYDLNKFDPILSISPNRTSAIDPATWSLEDPYEIGVFKEEFVTSLSIGIVVPF